MPARLAISTEEGPLLELELMGRPVTIGRAADNVVRSLDRRTSRHHVIVRRSSGGGYEVVDPGSSYGLLLNGRKVAQGQPERLAHMDLMNAGGVQVQYLVIDDVEEIDSDGPTGAFSSGELGEAERSQLRAEVQSLIDEQASLRRELGKAQEALARTEKERDVTRKERDATLEEVARLKGAMAEQREEIDRLGQRLEALGNELRNERSRPGGGGPGGGDEAARLSRQLVEAGKLAERHDARVKELEEREAQLVLKQQEQKKEIERLQELNQRREKREAELTQVVKPALARVAQLQQELEAMRVQLAQAQADLQEQRRR